MAEPQFRALIVDDDVIVRNLTMRAMAKEGFQCDAASDGLEAIQLCDCVRYDAVVTDLRMPNMHGHSLAAELLARDDRPLIVVLTAVTEPRLAKDLINRGVDDILFKPVEYSVLAAKLRFRVGRPMAQAMREAAESGDASRDASPHSAEQLSEDESTDSTTEKTGPRNEKVDLASISADTFQQEMSRVIQVMPASEQALEIYQLAKSGEFDARHLSRAIAHHDVLAGEIIQLANTPFYNPKGTRITDLERSVIQIGQMRIGQLALSANALAAAGASSASVFDLSTVWRRGVAAGFAAELLIAQGCHDAISSGLLLCATVQEFGRVALASIYPDHYEQMLQNCTKTSGSLFEAEQSMLPRSQSEVMIEILCSWNVTASHYAALQYVQPDYEVISQLEEPIRTRAELIKVAGLIARIAVGTWEPWDYVEIPPADVLERLRLLSISTVIKDTQRNIEGVNGFALNSPRQQHHVIREVDKRALAYLDASAAAFDFLPQIISSVELVPCANPTKANAAVLANCLGVCSKAVSSMAAQDVPPQLCVVSDRRHAWHYSRCSRTISLPASYAAVTQAVEASMS